MSNAAPRVIHQHAEMREQVLASQAAGERVGFVPTMGSLHAGHTSLVQRASSDCTAVAVSIFVNPTQFGPHEDFEHYPRDLDADCELLAQYGVRWIFIPKVAEVYPPNHATRIIVEGPAQPFEGLLRPGHFSGVATVVCRLFQSVPAHTAYFGAKDWQQSLVIKKMVDDLCLPIEIVVCPTIRDPDGLALSSRNSYLSPPERCRAATLATVLKKAEQDWQGGASPAEIERTMKAMLTATGVAVDYAVVVAADTLSRLSSHDQTIPAIALVAGRIGTTRLIDNLLLPPRTVPSC